MSNSTPKEIVARLRARKLVDEQLKADRFPIAPIIRDSIVDAMLAFADEQVSAALASHADPIAVIDRMIETYRSSGVDECLDWIELLQRARAALVTPAGEDARWLVWSNEHRAFWAPNRQGYTGRVEKAGRYSREEAEAICRFAAPRANSTINVGTPPEICMPAPEALAIRSTHDVSGLAPPW